MYSCFVSSCSSTDPLTIFAAKSNHSFYYLGLGGGGVGKKSHNATTTHYYYRVNNNKVLLPLHHRSFPPPIIMATSFGSGAGGTRAATATPAASKWAQKTVTIPPQRRGCHLITSKILKEIGQDLSGFKCGLAHLFLQHTSASLTINENYDSDVRDDTETFLIRVVPEGTSAPWKHTLEGPDDMPAHIKSSMFGCTLTIPITNGKLNMGTWQGIWLCEHRDSGTARQIVVTLNGL